MKALANGHKVFGGRERSFRISSKAGAGQSANFENAKKIKKYKNICLKKERIMKPRECLNIFF